MQNANEWTGVGFLAYLNPRCWRDGVEMAVDPWGPLVHMIPVGAPLLCQNGRPPCVEGWVGGELPRAMKREQGKGVSKQNECCSAGGIPFIAF